MGNSPLSTYDQLMQDPKRRQKFEEEYQKLVLVETLIPLLEKSKLSVRALAKAAGISPTIIQDIKSGKKEGISYPTFLSILEALGYKAKIHVTKNRPKTPPRPNKNRFPISHRRRVSKISSKV